MPRKAVNKENNDEIKLKLEYLGLDLQNIPQNIKQFKPINYRFQRGYEEKQHRQYRYIPIKDIQILLSPTNRLDDLQQKYKEASPLIQYLEPTNEENILKYTTFLSMLKNVKIEDIENVAQEQINLNKKIPFKVKFEGNFLWQIYYSESTNQYFMLVPTKDLDYSTFFFILKKQLEGKRTGKIFVPISNMKYSNTYLKKAEFDDLENYLWLFTKDWPLIYEVYDKQENLSIQIVGETPVYENIKSIYKQVLSSKEEATTFYKLVKAMFILQTELPHYYNFQTGISKSGGIEFFFNNKKMEYQNMTTWIKEQYVECIEKKEEASKKIVELSEKLNNLKQIAVEQEIEYLAKEKQISTFLECKKSFFGRFKYYFKYNKKSKNRVKNMEITKEEKVDDIKKEDIKEETKKLKENYTIEELIEIYKSYEIQENEMKNMLLDINSLKLKNKNMAKKIENATMYIQEIEKHKKSIFEFWRYSNKDEIAVLPEGEQEEINVVKKIEKVFNYKEDKEEFGKNMDSMQRRVLLKQETDSIYITTTNLLDIINKVKNMEVTPKEIENSLKELKNQAKEEKSLTEKEEFDIFGAIVEDSTKIKKIAGKKHRELVKDKFGILDISTNLKPLGYKLTLEKLVDNIKNALSKIQLQEGLPVYKISLQEEFPYRNFIDFNINPEEEINENLNKSDKGIYLFKINLLKGTKAIAYTNNIFYDNQNKTLPLGQDLSNKILIDGEILNLSLKKKSSFNIVQMEEKNNDFTKISVKEITVFEYDVAI